LGKNYASDFSVGVLTESDPSFERAQKVEEGR